VLRWKVIVEEFKLRNVGDHGGRDRGGVQVQDELLVDLLIHHFLLFCFSLWIF
jgi:hypothetical protein